MCLLWYASIQLTWGLVNNFLCLFQGYISWPFLSKLKNREEFEGLEKKERKSGNKKKKKEKSDKTHVELPLWSLNTAINSTKTGKKWLARIYTPGLFWSKQSLNDMAHWDSLRIRPWLMSLVEFLSTQFSRPALWKKGSWILNKHFSPYWIERKNKLLEGTLRYETTWGSSHFCKQMHNFKVGEKFYFTFTPRTHSFF